MAISNDWTNKSLKIQQETEKAEAFQAGVMNALMMISAQQKPGQSPGDDKTGDNRHDKDWPPPAPLKPKLAHTPHTPESTYDDYGRPEEVPRYKGGNPGGQLIEIPWMKEEYKKKHPELEKLHNEKYHNDLMISQGPDYIGDKRTYGKLDRILNPLGDFKKPTLDQLRIHAANYPKV